jgi:hypothetical protein
MNPAASLEDFRAAILPFLRQHGFAADAELSLLRGGANNRVFRVQDANQSAVLKQYFRNPNDPRDRFQAERAFYDFISANKIAGTPTPLGWESEIRAGLFSFVFGRKLTPAEINAAAVRTAAEFIVALNRHRTSEPAKRVLVASEACFTISQHLDCVDRRVVRLREMRPQEAIDFEAQTFVQQKLEPAWLRTRQRIEELAKSRGLNLATELSESLRCLSPSDFGFHNALKENESLKFFDFEYAGWDDPAKLICDFFCQPELPASREYWNDFAAQISASFPADQNLAARAELLYPAYQIKWCCIILNDFVKTEASRREFSLGEMSGPQRKKSQLEKARAAISEI